MRTVFIRPRIYAAFLLGASHLLVGCGGDSGGPSIPQVAGTYSLTESLTATTCTPTDPPPGGTVRLEAFSQTYDVQITQTGTALQLFEVGIPQAAETGTIASDGSMSFTVNFAFEEAPREGNRVFFVDLTVQRELQVQSATQISGSAMYVNVFHEDSITAPTYATCPRQATNELVRK
jgi:hypothetical protein